MYVVCGGGGVGRQPSSTLSYNCLIHCLLMAHILVCSRRPKTIVDFLFFFSKTVRQCTSFLRVS